MNQNTNPKLGLVNYRLWLAKETKWADPKRFLEIFLGCWLLAFFIMLKTDSQSLGFNLFAALDWPLSLMMVLSFYFSVRHPGSSLTYHEHYAVGEDGLVNGDELLYDTRTRLAFGANGRAFRFDQNASLHELTAEDAVAKLAKKNRFNVIAELYGNKYDYVAVKALVEAGRAEAARQQYDTRLDSLVQSLNS